MIKVKFKGGNWQKPKYKNDIDPRPKGIIVTPNGVTIIIT